MYMYILYYNFHIDTYRLKHIHKMHIHIYNCIYDLYVYYI